MRITNQKFYTVWDGWQTGVFGNKADFKQAIAGYTNASYQSFATEAKALEAYEKRYNKSTYRVSYHDFLNEGISVDGCYNYFTGYADYCGVNLATGETVFQSGLLRNGSNNMAEFLGVVHALSYCINKHLTLLPIYTENISALSWVRSKQVNTTVKKGKKNKRMFYALEQATNWLHSNHYKNPVLKWRTDDWGENPADFAHKVE